ncbi:MAG: RHS repeat-associated core domain-containing protein, partial [Gammaproteobacteria bacterium]|nr:RHS repeat-associated core domain-containing protein [Gammaproteobacteria bacterium]
KLWEALYAPYGDLRYHWDSTQSYAQTQYRYTSQRFEPDMAGGLYDYVARFYDPALGRFAQADTIVPEPGNPQSLNRFSYVGNNPIRYSDPSGHAPQHPGDPDPNNASCSTRWCWENRWYMARGYGWDGSGWGNPNPTEPVFYDQEVLTEMAADAGISFVGSWQFNRQMKAVGSGIALFGRNLAQGLGQLKALLGGGARLKHGSCMGSSCALPPGTQTVRFSQETLSSRS